MSQQSIERLLMTLMLHCAVYRTVFYIYPCGFSGCFVALVNYMSARCCLAPCPARPPRPSALTQPTCRAACRTAARRHRVRAAWGLGVRGGLGARGAAGYGARGRCAGPPHGTPNRRAGVHSGPRGACVPQASLTNFPCDGLGRVPTATGRNWRHVIPNRDRGS